MTHDVIDGRALDRRHDIPLPDPVLSVNIKSKFFQQKQVLGNINFWLMRGQTLILTGPSGVGKSTLLRMISGLDKEFEGEIKAPPRIGMIFQEPVLMPWATACRNLEIACSISKEAAMMHLASVGLHEQADLFPWQMSLGQQRRLGLVRAFAMSSEVLLMDEPFVSLDPDLADEMMQLFETLRAGRCVATILVTHSKEEAARLGGREIMLTGQPAVISTQTW